MDNIAYREVDNGIAISMGIGNMIGGGTLAIKVQSGLVIEGDIWVARQQG